ncbi:MAG: hypothetical protein Q7U14_16560, partial [Lacisediminimonas sp.]|nr:hypothetical protein [Lacisediminimonas sp.]
MVDIRSSVREFGASVIAALGKRGFGADQRGYNASMNDALSPKEIANHLGDAAVAVAIECVNQTGSTNADLLRRLPHLDSPLLLAAEVQTAGRGRAGR